MGFNFGCSLLILANPLYNEVILALGDLVKPPFYLKWILKWVLDLV